ncbi:MAG: siderophore-interacting protein [Burkholderiaceae bacterium]|jgi:NADPH-dependent ferric siderophore reductase|nr:siderophore-interacting protein [Burkholderiaceae bacterium]
MTLLQARTSVRMEQARETMHAVVEHMREHDIAVRQEGGRWVADYEGGRGQLWHADGQLHAEVAAPGVELLQDMKLMLAHLLLEALGSSEAGLAWQGDGAELQRPPAFRLLRVQAVRALTPHLRRVRLACDDIDRYAQDGNIHVKLLFPQPGVGDPEWPTLSASGLLRLPEGERRLDMRTYTMSATGRDAQGPGGWIDVDFVVHEDAGPGSAWAASAEPGQVIGMTGPGGRTATPADWMVLAGDDTALPAMLRIAAALPAHVRGHVFAEVQGPQDELPVRTPAGLRWHWLHRGEAAPGTGTLLPDALRALPWPDAAQEPASRFVWVGAEFDTAQAVRHWAREDCGLAKHEQLVVAYWRRGMSESQFKART